MNLRERATELAEEIMEQTACVWGPREEQMQRLIEQAILAGMREALGEAISDIPSNWCDPLLSGKTGITIPAGCPDIERLLGGILAMARKRLEGIE